jgi:hypothetical protein
MPVILPALPDPTDLVLQGAQLLLPDVADVAGTSWPLVLDPPDRLPAVAFNQVAQPFSLGMMDRSSRQFSARVSPGGLGLGIRANAVVCTPCGATLPMALGDQWRVNDIGQTTVTFVVTGTTRDSDSAPLGDCRVVVYETGRIAVASAPVVAEGVSSVSGVYTIAVPMNTAYQITAYKAGSPDVAGVTRADVVPTRD